MIAWLEVLPTDDAGEAEAEAEAAAKKTITFIANQLEGMFVSNEVVDLLREGEGGQAGLRKLCGGWLDDVTAAVDMHELPEEVRSVVTWISGVCSGLLGLVNPHPGHQYSDAAVQELVAPARRTTTGAHRLLLGALRGTQTARNEFWTSLESGWIAARSAHAMYDEELLGFMEMFSDPSQPLTDDLVQKASEVAAKVALWVPKLRPGACHLLVGRMQTLCMKYLKEVHALEDKDVPDADRLRVPKVVALVEALANAAPDSERIAEAPAVAAAQRAERWTRAAASSDLTSRIAAAPAAALSVDDCKSWMEVFVQAAGSEVSDEVVQRLALFRSSWRRQLVQAASSENRELLEALRALLGALLSFDPEADTVGEPHQPIEDTLRAFTDLVETAKLFQNSAGTAEERVKNLDLLTKLHRKGTAWGVVVSAAKDDCTKELVAALGPQARVQTSLANTHIASVATQGVQQVNEVINKLRDVVGGLRGGQSWTDSLENPENFDAVLEHFGRTLHKGPGKLIVTRKEEVKEALRVPPDAPCRRPCLWPMPAPWTLRLSNLETLAFVPFSEHTRRPS